MILLGVSAGWKLIVLTLGAAVPRWVIGDGMDLIPVGARVYAEQAKVTAATLWDHPLERLGLVQALRVMRVDTLATRTDTTAVSAGSATPSCAERVVTVRAYTYFAIPYSEARTICDSGVVKYRGFRPRS